jgi:hypothetical protein
MKLKINPQTTKNMPIFGCPVWVLWFYCSQNLKLFGFAICRFWMSLMKDYSRNASYALNLISTFLAHLALKPCDLLSSLFVRRPSVNISHFLIFTSSPQKPLGQLQPNFGGMVLGWPPFKIVSNQDGRQAKNRKKGGWNFNCPLGALV